MAEKFEHTYGTDVTRIISKITLPDNTTYEIHDAKAIHSAEDLGLSAALRYLGTKATKDELPSTGNKNGDVWHVTADEYEYVWNGTAWEELGAPHDFVGTTKFDKHTHSFTAPTVTIPSLTGTGTISGYGANTTKLSATAQAPTISAGSSNTSVLKSTAATTVNATTGVTPTPGAQTKGTAASWGATVSNGTLTFSWTANTPSEVQTSVVTGVTANNSDIEVKFDTQDATNIPTSWTASAPKITLASGNTGDVSVATGVKTSGTVNVTVTTTQTPATVSGGSVGTPNN